MNYLFCRFVEYLKIWKFENVEMWKFRVKLKFYKAWF